MARDHTLRTAILIQIGGAEVEYNATIAYRRIPAFDGGRVSPSEPAYCEVNGITVDFTQDRRIPLDDLIVAELQNQLQPTLMEDWAEDNAAAAEHRADARRDDLMMERF